MPTDSIDDNIAEVRAKRASLELDRYITAQRLKTLAAKWPFFISDLYARFDALVRQFNENLPAGAPHVTVERIINGCIRARIGVGARWQVTLKHDVDARTLTAFYEEFTAAGSWQDAIVSYVRLSKDEELEICMHPNDSFQIPRDKFVLDALAPIFRSIRPTAIR